MKNSILKLSLFSIIGFGLLTSCSKNDDNKNVKDSRTVKYEITGNAIGTYDAVYITGSATGASAIPTSLPWAKEEVMKEGNNMLSITTSVDGATPGQKFTAKIFVGGIEKNSQTETVQANGMAVISSLSYTLK